jgi:hypothetical protein
MDLRKCSPTSLPHDQPIQSFSLEVDGDKRTEGKAWFDEVAVAPLPQE